MPIFARYFRKRDALVKMLLSTTGDTVSAAQTAIEEYRREVELLNMVDPADAELLLHHTNEIKNRQGVGYKELVVAYYKTVAMVLSIFTAERNYGPINRPKRIQYWRTQLERDPLMRAAKASEPLYTAILPFWRLISDQLDIIDEVRTQRAAVIAYCSNWESAETKGAVDVTHILKCMNVTYAPPSKLYLGYGKGTIKRAALNGNKVCLFAKTFASKKLTALEAGKVLDSLFTPPTLRGTLDVVQVALEDSQF